MQRIASYAWTIVVLVAASLFSCARAPGSLVLALELHPGMVHTTRFSIRERFDSKLPRLPTGSLRVPGAPGDLSTSMTYRFRVVSLDSGGVAKLRCTVLAAETSMKNPEVSRYLQSLEKTPYILFIDREGRLVGERSSPNTRALMGRGPLAPGSLSGSGPLTGDVGAIFGGLNGRRVSVGSTWTSPLPGAAGPGLSGKITWTVESIGRSTSRLAFEGSIEQRRLPLPAPAGGSAELQGKVQGFVVIETESSWPIQGKSVIDATLSLPGDAAVGIGPRRLASTKIISLFDPAQ